MSTSALNILLVEDDSEDRELAQEASKILELENKLFMVETAEKALQFLQKEGDFAQKPLPDVILLDLNLPKMSGEQFLTEIKQDSTLAGIPIAILTGSDSKKHIIKEYDQATHKYFQKPIGIDEFVSTIREIEKFCHEIKNLL